MRRFIITGTPGATKTAINRQSGLDGFGVVEEAATDVITAAQARSTPNHGLIRRLLMQSLVCKGSGRFARLVSQVIFSSTTVRFSVPLHWPSILDIPSPRFSGAKWNAFKTKPSSRTGSSSYAILVSSRPLKRDGLALRRPYVLKKSTKSRTVAWATDSFQ
jgi:hypothetical protein